MTLTPLQALTQARAKIEDINHWTQGRLAAGAEPDSDDLDANDPDACRFCAIGALCNVNRLSYVYPPMTLGLDELIAASIAPFGTYMEVVGINDGQVDVEDTVDKFTPEQCHANVLALYDRAIATAQQQ